MSIKQVLKDKKTQLASAGISEVDAELILAFVLGVERMELHARDFDLELEQVELLDELITKRISGKPTQYLIGHAPFRYLTFQVGQGVLIPRPESEALVEAALIENEKSQLQNKESALRILRARLLADAQEKAEAAAMAERKSQVRTVDRSERIRTYNYPENRLSDHRVNYKSNNLDAVLNGELDDVVQALLDADKAAKLASTD